MHWRLLIWAGLVLHLARAFIRLMRDFMCGLLGRVLGGVPGLFGSTLDAMACIFSRVFGVMTGIFHVLLKA